jgi:hypothetical protein
VESEQAGQRLRAPTPAALRQHDHAAQQTGSPGLDADAISLCKNASRNEDDDEPA